MTLATRSFRLHLLSVLGAPLPGARVSLRLSSYQADETDIVPLDWKLTEDPSAPGDYIGPVWPNTRNNGGTHYDMLVQASGQVLLAEVLTVTMGAGEAVHTAKINPAPYPPVYAAEKAVADANTFADASGESASRALAGVSTIGAIAEEYGTVAEAAEVTSQKAIIATNKADAAAATLAAVQGVYTDVVGAAMGGFDYPKRIDAEAALANGDIPLNKGLVISDDGANNGYWVNRAGTLVRSSKATIGSLAVETETPRRMGMRLGWSDPFFRNIPIRGIVKGRQRWYMQDSNADAFMSLVPNTMYPKSAGRMLWRAPNAGVNNLGGPLIWLDEFGLVPGVDRVTIRAMVAGDNVQVFFAALPVDVGGVKTADQITSGLVANNVPGLATLDFPVPENTVCIQTYSFTTTPDKGFATGAFWVSRGGAGDSPETPIFTDIDYEWLKGQERDAKLGELQEAADAPLSYAFLRLTKVEAAHSTVQVPVTGAGVIPRDDEYAGWAELLQDSGKSFNAIDIKMIARAPGSRQWSELMLVLRTGADPGGAGATVLAVSRAAVRPSQDVLQNVRFLLKHPDTGQVRTCQPSDMIAGRYMVGVWGKTADGRWAAVGQPLGTMSNSLGVSFYVTSAGLDGGNPDPVTRLWTQTSAGAEARLGFEHLLLTDPVETLAIAPTQEFATDAAAMAAIPTPIMAVPPRLYALEGQESNFYFRNVHADDVGKYRHKLTTNYGKHLSKRWRYVPNSYVANGTWNLSVYDERTGALIATHNRFMCAAGVTSGAGKEIKVHNLGDSWIEAGYITGRMKERSDADVMKIRLIGTRGSGDNKHDGRGGFRVDDYATAGRQYRVFNVTNVQTRPAVNSTPYGQNGSVYRVQEVQLDGNGNGTFNCSLVSGPDNPNASGQLVKLDGDGDSTVAFTSSALSSGNPLWIGGKVDYPAFLTVNSLPVPDWLNIWLDINDLFGMQTDEAVVALAAARFDMLDTIIASAKLASPSLRVALAIASPAASQQDAFGLSDPTQTQMRYHRNIVIYAREKIARYGGRESERIELIPINVSIDIENNAQVLPTTAANACCPVYFNLPDLPASDIPGVGAVYSHVAPAPKNTPWTWRVWSVESFQTQNAQVLSIRDSQGGLTGDSVVIPARYSVRLGMVPALDEGYAAEIGNLTKVSGTGGAVLAYDRLAGGVRLQTNAVHTDAFIGYPQAGDAAFAFHKFKAH